MVLAGGAGAGAEGGGGAEGGTGTGAGTPEEPGGRPGGSAEGTSDEGGFVALPSELEATGTGLLPSAGDGDELVCECFLEEPSLLELGEDGERLNDLMAVIADKLQLSMCNYAGGFALMAASGFESRAMGVGQFTVTAAEAFVQAPAAGSGQGNLGIVDFTPAPSPAIAFMRHIAGVAPDITRLEREIRDVYEKPEHRGKIKSFDDPISWIWRFLSELNGRMERAVGIMFASTCRILLLQLLQSSLKEIDGRLANIDAFSEMFAAAVVPQLKRVEELTSLRDRLKAMERIERDFNPNMAIVQAHLRGVPGAATATTTTAAPAPDPNTLQSADEAQQAWAGARAQVADSMATAQTTVAAPDPVADPSRAGEITRLPEGLQIRDAQGRQWTLDALERAIVTRRGVIESVDPLVKQLVELDEVLSQFRDPDMGVKQTLELLLNEMRENNLEQTEEVADDWEYAFEASLINRSLPTATVAGTQYAMGGIHLLAHEAIGDAFRGDGFYSMGIEWIFGREQAQAGILQFIEFAGVLFLAVVCPPAALAVGAAFAAYHLHVAHEREQLYESLIDPELVITRAEVETELFVARLGFALSIIPEAGTILRAGSSAVRAVARTGVRAAARAAPRAAGRALAARISEEMARSLRHGLVVGFVRELAVFAVIDQVAQRVIGPIVAELEREVTITGPVGGMTGAMATLERLVAEADRAAAGTTGSTGAVGSGH